MPMYNSEADEQDVVGGERAASAIPQGDESDDAISARGESFIYNGDIPGLNIVIKAPIKQE